MASNPSPRQPVVCVFCGSSPGRSPAHLAAARGLAHALHAHGLRLVYGGGTVGVMGEVARTLVQLAGPDAVHGVIPAPLVALEQQRNQDNNKHSANDPPGAHHFGRTTVVRDMHARKKTMARDVIDGGPGGGFVALSGGYGTLEELMEVTTWNQLGIHSMPVVVYNVDGYWDGLLAWVRTAVQAGFVNPDSADVLVEARAADDVVRRLRDYRNAEGCFNLTWDDD